MNKFLRVFTGGISVFLFTQLSAEVKTTLDASIHQDYVSVRALGMGNAFSAVVDDHSALFYNPAALALRKSGVIRGYLRGGASQNWSSFLSGLDENSNSAEGTNPMATFLESKYGESYNLSVPMIGLHWVRPNWGMAFIPLNPSIDLSIHKAGAPSISMNAYVDTVLAYGYGAKWKKAQSKLGGNVSWGMTWKLIHRILASESLSLADLAADGGSGINNDSAGEGLTVDADFGLLWSPKITKKGWLRFSKPTFSLVMRNALDYGYITNLHVVSENSPEPSKLQRRVDMGSKWDLPNFWVFDPHFAFEVRDLLHENLSLKKGIHMGAELDWEMFSWWKGNWNLGINQGYPTMGLGARFAFFNLDLAYYAEELGTDDFPSKSERLVMEMSLEF